MRAFFESATPEKDQRTTRVVESVGQDIRYAVRGLRRRPVFALSATLTIGVGIGALATVLSVVSAVLLRPAPYPTADRIVQIEQVVDGRPRDEVSTLDVRALSEGSASLSHVTIAWFSEASIAADGLPERARRVYTDSQAFAMLGVRPLIGRLPTKADEALDADPVVILGHRLWSERFGSDPAVIGRAIRVDGRPSTVIGVMPAGFAYPAPYWAGGDLWLLRGPSHPSWPATRAGFTLGFGLLEKGQTLARAQAEVDAVAAALDARYPDSNGPIGLRLTGFAADVRAEARPRLLLILGAASVLFLIVCVNVVNLLIGRGLDRQRELAARVALGAGPARLVRQLLTETAVMFLTGGAVGLLAAVQGSRLMAAVQSLSIPRMDEASVDGTVVIVTIAVTMIAAAIVGLVPAWQGVRSGLSGLAGSDVRSASQGRRWRHLQRTLIAVEVGLALVLLSGAGVLLEGARTLARTDPGFDVSGLMRARITLPPENYATANEQHVFYDRVLARVRSALGVTAVGLVDVPPGVGGRGGPSISVDGDPTPTSIRDLRRSDVRLVSVGYLETLGLAARSGRVFSASDASLPVAVVNETFARRYQSGATAVGRRVRVRLGADVTDLTAFTIIGVVPDVREKTVYEPPPPTVYLPFTQAGSSRTSLLRMSLLVRSPRPPADLAFLVRRAIADADAGLAPSDLVAMRDLLAAELSLNRVNLALLAVLAVVSLCFAVLGVYAVTAHSVRQRTREMGIRLALGDSPRGLQLRLLREGVLLVTVGLAFGGIAAVWTAGLLRSAVYGIDRTSPVTFAGAGLVLAAAVLFGCYLPARHAAQIDPVAALRAD